MSSFIFVIVATSDRKEAQRIAIPLLDERLIACANIVGPVSSLFWWRGKIEKAEEFFVFMKSKKNLFEKITERVKKLHSYEVPEIISLPITDGETSYIEWLDASLRIGEKQCANQRPAPSD